RLPRMLQNNWHEECRLYLGLKPQVETEQLSLYLPNSHCTRCKKTIKPWHNIPILSYLLLRGRCANCNASISLRYPMVEIITTVASVYVAWQFGISWQTFAALIFTWTIVALTFIDIDFFLLPDQLTLLLVWVGLFFNLFSLFCPLPDAVIGAMAGYLIFAFIGWIFTCITGKVGMGQGDFKLLAAFGAFLGWQQLPMIILLSSLIGAVFGITHIMIKRQSKNVPLPFGPYLAVAGWIALMWGPEITSAYLQMVS
ncbi:MAG TPA: A24 family peptidase, partial [Gammaproteobacteria bacterium]|nr:A24 family peptidase [Gammaproteobacteria bacterium]